MINQASSHLYECVGASKILLKQNLPFLLEYEPLSLCCQQWCLAFCPRPNPKHRAADIRDGYYAPHSQGNSQGCGLSDRLSVCRMPLVQKG